MKRSTKIAFLLIVGLLLAGVGYVAAAGGVPDLSSLRPQRTFTVEVAENGTRFSPDGDPLDSDGSPSTAANLSPRDIYTPKERSPAIVTTIAMAQILIVTPLCQSA